MSGPLRFSMRFQSCRCLGRVLKSLTRTDVLAVSPLPHLCLCALTLA